VWEIGGGWGGFAYQFKTLCPNATYLIVDLPELFLFSAVYLMTLFPRARVRFWEGQSASELLSSLEDVDFVFIPAGALDSMRPERLDLTINMVSFQEMTTAQVRGYVHHAHEIGSPFLYSLNRDRSLYNTELSSVRELLAERYRTHEIPLLDLGYTKLPRAGDFVTRALEGVRDPRSNEYRHVVGWRRP